VDFLKIEEEIVEEEGGGARGKQLLFENRKTSKRLGCRWGDDRSIGSKEVGCKVVGLDSFGYGWG
jgi:hypothetical protein